MKRDGLLPAHDLVAPEADAIRPDASTPDGASTTVVATRPSQGWPSYAAVWRERDGPLCVGRIELGPRSLRLAGTAPLGRPCVRQLQYGDVAGVRIGRSADERLNGLPVLVLELREQAPLHLRTVNGAGTLNELAEFIATLLAEVKEGSTRFAVIVPLKEGTQESARRLIEQGPPFDPSRVALARHHVFLGEREVVFLFESSKPLSSIEALVADAGIWHAAASWEACIAAPPRVIADAYTWVKA